MREAGQEEGPLQPNHIREAVRRLRGRDKVPKSRYKKVLQTYTQLIHGHQAEAVLFRHQRSIIAALESDNGETRRHVLIIESAWICLWLTVSVEGNHRQANYSRLGLCF